jgi:parvulin-like peptidyl-prolyl isomerase
MDNKTNKPKVVTKKHVARLERERRQVALVRTVAIVMFGLIALLLAYGYLNLNYLQLQKPVVEVNEESITLKYWQERVQLERKSMLDRYQYYQYLQQSFNMDVSQQIQDLQYYLQTPEALGQLVIDRLIDEALIRQEAEKRGITVSEEEVEKAIQEAFNFFPNGTPVPSATPTAFEYPTLTSEQLTLSPWTATPTKVLTSTPASTSTPDPTLSPTATFTEAPPTPTFVPEDVTPTATPYTLENFTTQYQNTLEEYDTIGVSEEVLRGAFENDLLRNKLLEALTADMLPSAEQVWARHILISDPSQADVLHRLLLQGSDFAKAARDHSEDTSSGVNGGDLGWFGRGAMVPAFEEAAFSQEIGEIGEPVQSQFGYHIIQVLDRQELPLDASQLEQERNAVFSEWLDSEKVRAEFTIEEAWMEHVPRMRDPVVQPAQ